MCTRNASLAGDRNLSDEDGDENGGESVGGKPFFERKYSLGGVGQA